MFVIQTLLTTCPRTRSAPHGGNPVSSYVGASKSARSRRIAPE